MTSLTRKEAEEILLATIRKVGEENLDALAQKVETQAQTGFHKEVTAEPEAAPEEKKGPRREEEVSSELDLYTGPELVKHINDAFERRKSTSSDEERKAIEQSQKIFQDILKEFN